MDLTDYTFYNGFARYGQFGNGGHVFTASKYGASDVLESLTKQLDAGDIEAIDAGYKINALIRDRAVFMGCDDDPVIALQKCIARITSASEEN